MIFSADGLQWTADESNLVTGLKGLVGLEITVTGAAGDQHSGLHGGGIANPLQALSHVLASLKDTEGRITVDGFYDDVLDLTEEDRADIARVPWDEAAYVSELGIPEVFGEPGYTTRERLWARPTLDINGLTGGYQGGGSKTVLPAMASAKVTCRLVANQKPDRIFELISQHVERHLPRGVRVSVERLQGSADPYQMPRNHNASRVAGEVLTEIYGAEPYITRVGGSIPVTSVFLNELGAHTIMAPKSAAMPFARDGSRRACWRQASIWLRIRHKPVPMRFRAMPFDVSANHRISPAWRFGLLPMLPHSQRGNATRWTAA